MKLRANIDEHGKMTFTGSQAWVKSRIKDLRPGAWDVIFKPHVETVSDPQRKYYWAVIVESVYHGLRDAGFEGIHDREDAHEVIKNIFFKQTLYSDSHDNIITTVSITKIPKDEMTVKFEEIWQWAKEYLGITILPPNTQGKLEL